MTLAFRIVTPWSAVTNERNKMDANIIWLPNAVEPKATEIDILILKSDLNVNDWPGKHSMGTSLVGSIPLANGETVWGVYWVVDMPDFSKVPAGTGHFYKGKTDTDLESEGLRALVFGNQTDGSRVIYDCVVKSRTEKT
jgi:hypothetical protein